MKRVPELRAARSLSLSTDGEERGTDCGRGGTARRVQYLGGFEKHALENVRLLFLHL